MNNHIICIIGEDSFENITNFIYETNEKTKQKILYLLIKYDKNILVNNLFSYDKFDLFNFIDDSKYEYEFLINNINNNIDNDIIKYIYDLTQEFNMKISYV